MKKIILGVFAALLMAGCSACQNIKGTATSDYDQHFEDFNNDLKALGYQPIDFSQTVVRVADNVGEKNTLGYCHEIALKRKGLVNISLSTALTGYGYDIIKATIYHEIGHCFLGLNHTEGRTLMSDNNLRTLFTFDQIIDERKRLILVKEMIESSDYKSLQFISH